METAQQGEYKSDDEWMDHAAGEAVRHTREAEQHAHAARDHWADAGRLVAALAEVVTAGHGKATTAAQASTRAQVAATGVWAFWQRVKPRLKRYRHLFGGGASVCGLALAALLWPKPATASPVGQKEVSAPLSARTVGDGEGEIVRALERKDWGAAERGCSALPDGRRYLLLGEAARGRGDEPAARWYFRRAVECGERLGALALS